MVQIITIDGPASSGKSSLAKKISLKYDSPILYSGRLYRAVALDIINQNINLNNKSAILKCIKRINKKKLDSKELFSRKVDLISSVISSKKYIRESLCEFQKSFPKKYAKKNHYAIIEGRDIGTIIFPKAKYKIFMWADAEIRAKRRYEQIIKNGGKASIKTIYKEIVARDKKDMSRKIAPLKPAVNSVLLDTTYLDIEQAFNAIIKILTSK